MSEPITFAALHAALQANHAPGHLAARRIAEELEKQVREFVDKLKLIHADPRYEAVWTIHMVHAGPYKGPDYVKELAALEAALGDK